jgi:hypothetical protein
LIVSGVAYGDVHGGKSAEKVKADMDKKAVSSLSTAAALPWQTLQDTHTEVSCPSQLQSIT